MVEHTGGTTMWKVGELLVKMVYVSTCYNHYALVVLENGCIKRWGLQNYWNQGYKNSESNQQ